MMTSAASAASESGALPPPPRADLASMALFLDIDGTLLDLAARPDSVVVEPTLRSTLVELHRRLDGALAPLSGRSLRDIDALLHLPAAAAAGLHGAELRAPGNDAVSRTAETRTLETARSRAIEAAATIPGLLVEDKGGAIALHYRQAPAAEAGVRRLARDLLEHAGPDFGLQDGNCVIELKPLHADKGTALATLMRIAPFAGRTPWMIGDDLTDEDAFAEANAHGGVSIIVGPRRPTLARHSLPGPAGARAWLARLLAGDEAADR
jgi:trehalose 6-phosphate phosphatase